MAIPVPPGSASVPLGTSPESPELGLLCSEALPNNLAGLSQDSGRTWKEIKVRETNSTESRARKPGWLCLCRMKPALCQASAEAALGPQGRNYGSSTSRKGILRRGEVLSPRCTHDRPDPGRNQEMEGS